MPNQSIAQFPSVAIVILNYNGQKYLEKFLPSVVKTNYPNFKIIIADNASTDDSVSWLKNNYPTIEIIINDKNYGFAGGYNVALKKVQSDYWVLLNSDVEVNSNWLSPIIDLMNSNEKIAACQPKIRMYDAPEKFEYAGASGGWIDEYGYPFARGRVFDDVEIDTGQYNEAQQCFWATGAALVVRPTIFNSVGGFDDYFFAHQEEIDLCWRMQRAGYEIWVEPKSVVYHVGGGTLPKTSARKTFLNFRNNLIMLHKNLNPQERFFKILFRLEMDGIAGLKFLFSGKFDHVWAIIKAHFGFYKWAFSKKERIDLPKPKLNQLSGVYDGSVVWAYFKKGKKRFSEIVQKI